MLIKLLMSFALQRYRKTYFVICIYVRHKSKILKKFVFNLCFRVSGKAIQRNYHQLQNFISDSPLDHRELKDKVSQEVRDVISHIYRY